MFKKLFIFQIVIALCFVVVSCSGPKIDGSSKENYKKSFEKIKEKLTEEEKEQLDDAMLAIAFNGSEFDDLSSMDPDDFLEDLMKKLDGKSAKEIIEEGQRIICEKEMKEMNELEGKKKEVEVSAKQLKKIEISDSKFYKRQEMFGVQPIINFKAKNGLDVAISKIYCKGTISSPERSVPWFSDEFNYSIPGGLEPGETASWSLAPNMFSDWAYAKNPKGSVFSIEVMQVDGADGEILYTMLEFDEEDEKRLEELQAKYTEEAK